MPDSDAPITLDSLLVHRAWVRSVARAMVGDANCADDVEQDVWLAALERPPTHAASPRGWLGTVTRNFARRLHRDAATRQRYESSVLARAPANPAADLVAEAELQQRIARAVLDLEEPFRATVLLRYFDGLPIREVAQELDVPVETVRSRLRRALDRLRGRLDGDSHGRRSAWALPVLAWTDAAPAPPSRWVTAAPTALIGGIVVKKLAVASLVLLAVAAASWFVWPGGQSTSTSSPDDDVAPASQASQPGGVHTLKRELPANAIVEDVIVRDVLPADLPPSVDLNAIDRDLDIHGTVVDGDGVPVPGARVAAVSYPWRGAGLPNSDALYEEEPGPETRSAQDGSFSLRLARGERVSLRVAAEGYAIAEIPMVSAGSRLQVTVLPGVRLVIVASDAAGDPLVGARVRITSHWTEAARMVHAEGTTDAAGLCVLDDLPPRAPVWIRVHHAMGRINRRAMRVELPSAGELRREVRVPGGRTLTGIVTDAITRVPVPGARVGPVSLYGEWEVTDSEGRYELKGWSDGQATEVRVVAAGFAPAQRFVGDASAIDIQLRRAATVRGRVVAVDGTPVANARVGMSASDDVEPPREIGYGQMRRFVQTNDAYATTDQDGRFHISGLWPGLPHILVVTAAGHARVRRETPLPSGMEEVNLGDVIVGPPHRVEGGVVAEDGKPRPRVQVKLTGPKRPLDGPAPWGDDVFVFTDDLGRFRFADVGPGEYELAVGRESSHVVRQRISVPEDADVLDIVVEQVTMRTVAFTVTDQTGVPVESVYVSAMADRSNSRAQHFYGRSDAEGRVRLDVPAGRTFQLAVSTRQVATPTYLVTPYRWLGRNETDVRIVLEESAQVTGRIINAQANPMPGAVLRIEGPGPAPDARVVADADGRFRASVGVTGRWSIVFDGAVRVDARPSHQDAGLVARADDVRPGADVLLRCSPLHTERSVTILVVSPEGLPVPDAGVYVQRGTAWSQRYSTDATGHAVIERLPEWEIQVYVSQPAEADFLPPPAATVVPNGQVLRLVCRPASLITGTVVGRDGSPLPYSVNATRAGERVAVARMQPRGRFVVLLPIGETEPVRLEVDLDMDGTPELVLDDVAPGTENVRLIEME